MEALPDVLTSLACLNCVHVGTGLGASGLCAGNQGCGIYPVISFSTAQCKPALIAAGYTVDKLSDSEVELLYMQEVQKRVEKRKESS